MDKGNQNQPATARWRRQRLSWQCGRSNREIAQSCAISHTAVNDYLGKAKLAEISPDTFEKMSDEEIMQKIQAMGTKSERLMRPQPDLGVCAQRAAKKERNPAIAVAGV